MSINRGLKQINSCALAIAMNEMPEDKEQLVHDNDKEGVSGFIAQAREAFSWNNFFYNLLFGLLPSALDILTDFRFASILDKRGQNTVTVGLAYVIILMPGNDIIYLFAFQKVWNNLEDALAKKIFVTFASIAIACLLLVGMFFSITHMPTILFYPAVLVASFFIGIKLVAVVIHTKRVQDLSVIASGCEGNLGEPYCDIVI